ncbi:MAG: heme o synthase [Vicinamibacterales bacterium]|nr:heme o synthase [Vicinamibacterales bacterium]
MKSTPATSPDTLPIGTAAATRADGGSVADFVTLTKPRLNFLVVATALAGYALGAERGAPLATLLHTVIGTALVAGGASALNQLWEKDTDRLMRRTRLRPLPDLRVPPVVALWFGLILSAAGLLQLWLGANLLAAFVAFVTLVSYVLCYTPLKLRTSLSTIIGAVPGALPAAIGWVAATNRFSIEAWVLFAIVFMWQMPHFLAIGWMYRDDYAQAGIPLLPVIQPDGRSTGRQAVLYAGAMIPVTMLPSFVGLASPYYMVGALVLGLVVLVLSVEFAATRTMATARRLFLGTILYLPLLWGLLLADHFLR